MQDPTLTLHDGFHYFLLFGNVKDMEVTKIEKTVRTDCKKTERDKSQHRQHNTTHHYILHTTNHDTTQHTQRTTQQHSATATQQNKMQQNIDESRICPRRQETRQEKTRDRESLCQPSTKTSFFGMCLIPSVCRPGCHKTTRDTTYNTRHHRQGKLYLWSLFLSLLFKDSCLVMPSESFSEIVEKLRVRKTSLLPACFAACLSCLVLSRYIALSYLVLRWCYLGHVVSCLGVAIFSGLFCMLCVLG